MIPPPISEEELWAAQIGQSVPADEWAAGEERRHELLWQSRQIVAKLEAVGEVMRTGKISAIGLVSGLVATTDSYRNCNIIPVMQSRNVHDMLQHVAYWMDNGRPAWTRRMWVISNGFQKLDLYRRNHQAFTRRISRLAADPYLKEKGVRLVYYTIENTLHHLGRVPVRDRLNHHAHVLVDCARRLPKAEWLALIQYVRAQFPKGYVHDGAIRNAKELVKYVFKPSELLKLSGKRLAFLFREMKGLRFYIPLGEMREFRGFLTRERMKLRKVRCQGEREWRLLPKFECHRSSMEGRTHNLLVTITTPSPRLSPLFEPQAIVRDWDGDLVALKALYPWLEGMIERAKDQARQNENRNQRRRRFMGHKTTITVPELPHPDGFRDVIFYPLYPEVDDAAYFAADAAFAPP